MFDALCNVTQSVNRFEELRRNMEALKKQNVLVGVPEEKASRGEEGINNAELAYAQSHGIRSKSMRKDMESDLAHGTSYSNAHQMYIQSHGSPLWNVQPRPIIEPAIEKHKEEISVLLRDAALKASEGKDFMPALNRVGLQGQRIIKDWFTSADNNWAPNAPSTIEAKGSNKPLIDEGSLRASIGYVIKER